MKIALDCSYGKHLIIDLIRAGHTVVYVADGNEPDSFWFYESLERGADVIVSRDYDIDSLCQTHGIQCIMTKPKNRESICSHVLSELKKIRRNLKTNDSEVMG